jgi:thiosulfate dehydrogenase [quinone] large subunit
LVSSGKAGVPGETNEEIMAMTSDERDAISSQARSANKLDRALACLLLRLTLGLNIALHGITRIFLGGLTSFVNATLTQFQSTPLPVWQVRAFATAIPFLEVLIGVLLFVGLWTRWALSAGALLMMALVFGTALRSEWNLLFLQMFYSFLYFLLLMCRQYDSFSIDGLRGNGLRKAR